MTCSVRSLLEFRNGSRMEFGDTADCKSALRGAFLFADAELAEDGIEQIFGSCLANDFADGIHADTQLESDYLERLIVAEAAGCGVEGSTGTFQGIFVA